MELRQLKGSIVPPREGSDSLVIACASYERRCRAFTERLVPGFAAERSVLFFCREYADKGMSPENREILAKSLERISVAPPTPRVTAAKLVRPTTRQTTDWTNSNPPGRCPRVSMSSEKLPR